MKTPLADIPKSWQAQADWVVARLLRAAIHRGGYILTTCQHCGAVFVTDDRNAVRCPKCAALPPTLTDGR